MKMSDEEIRARISQLERENAELTRANEILKDALGFFAKDRKK
jgi:transposase